MSEYNLFTFWRENSRIRKGILQRSEKFNGSFDNSKWSIPFTPTNQTRFRCYFDQTNRSFLVFPLRKIKGFIQSLTHNNRFNFSYFHFVVKMGVLWTLQKTSFDVKLSTQKFKIRRTECDLNNQSTVYLLRDFEGSSSSTKYFCWIS